MIRLESDRDLTEIQPCLDVTVIHTMLSGDSEVTVHFQLLCIPH